MLRYAILLCTAMTIAYSYPSVAMDPDETAPSASSRKANPKPKGKKAKPVVKRKASVSEASSSHKPKRKKKKTTMVKATEEEVDLREGRGGKETGGGEGGHYWSIFWRDARAGKVYINVVDAEPVGVHPSIQIYLNKKSQRKGIGSIAYRKACELSRYDRIFAHMSKKNVGSIRAAMAAGFVQVFAETTRQMLMQWERKKKVSQ